MQLPHPLTAKPYLAADWITFLRVPFSNPKIPVQQSHRATVQRSILPTSSCFVGPMHWKILMLYCA